MKITLENSVYKQNALTKTYRTDFLSKENSVKKIHIESEGIRGTVEDFSFNGVCVSIKEIVNSDIFEERISNDFSMYKLHFTIKGSYHFSVLNNPVGNEIPEGYCNLCYFQKFEGIQKLTGERVVTVEVLFTERYLKSLLGESYKKASKNIGDFPADKTVSCLWENSKRTAPKITPFLIDIVQSPYSGRARESLVRAKIDCLLIEFFLGRHPSFDTDLNLLPKMDYEAVLKVEAYIKQNLKKRLTIDDLSSLAGFNTTKLKHDFKKIFSITIFKHITRLRMEKAKQLILDNDFSISQASYEVGYTNPQHFTVAFKKTMGYLPSKLKKNNMQI